MHVLGGHAPGVGAGVSGLITTNSHTSALEFGVLVSYIRAGQATEPASAIQSRKSSINVLKQIFGAATCKCHPLHDADV